MPMAIQGTRTVQGQGYQATADLQLADGREGAAQCTVVRPLRDISRKELALVCYFAQVPFEVTPELPRAAQGSSVNALSANFISLLQVRREGGIWFMLLCKRYCPADKPLLSETENSDIILCFAQW